MFCKCGREIEDPIQCPEMKPDVDGESLVCSVRRHRVYIPMDMAAERERLKKEAAELNYPETCYTYVSCIDCGKPIRALRKGSGSVKRCRNCKHIAFLEAQEKIRRRRRKHDVCGL